MKKVFIIAEAGVNHNGDIDIAKEMILQASRAGADAIKFQTFKSENLVTKYADKAQYQVKTTGGADNQLDMLKRLELSYEVHEEVMECCRQNNIQFLSTAFDEESALFLRKLGLNKFKISSGEITNYPLLRIIGGFKTSVILSTGMSTLDEVNQAIYVLRKFGTEDIVLMHCNTQYPTPYADVNLKAMITLKKKFGLPVGYSDHTIDIEIPIAATAMGACAIEKHFTLDKNMEGPDHKASIEPEQLKSMIVAIRNVEQALGDGVKSPSISETENISVVRKSIVAKCNIQAGDIFTEENITTKRPGTGISPMKWNEIIGMSAPKEYKRDELIVL